MALTKGFPAATNGWEQLVYVPALKQSIMLSLYHQRNSEPNESIVGYNFDTNSWDVIDMGGNFHTENIPEGGESQGYFDYDPNNQAIVYHCCTTGSNQSENANHMWLYDVLGQSGRDRHTSPKPPFSALQPGGAFDPAHNVFMFHGGDSYVGTWTYDPVANSWQHMNPTGSLPNPSLILPTVAYSGAEQKLYMFGGYQGGTYYSDLHVYDVGTNTWTLVTPADGVTPPGRYRHAVAYDSTNNIFLLYGGQNASGVLGDTWVYNPATNLWSQIDSPANPPPTSAIFTRLAYDSDHNVFVLAAHGTGGYFGGNWTAFAIQTWLFRYAGAGPNAGTQSLTAQTSAGGVNRNTASWAKDPAIASSGTDLYVAWSETGSPFDPTSSAWPHIYVSQYSGGNWLPLGTSSSISIDLDEAHSPSIAVIGGTPWASWYEVSNTGQLAQVSSKSWDGANWNGGPVGKVASPGWQGRSQLLGIGGVPYVALLENDRSEFPQRTWLYVRAWNGTAWPLVGSGALNRNNVTGTTADSVSITTDGTNPWVAWTEYAHDGGSPVGDIDTNPQVYVAMWNGSQWTPVGGSLNVDTTEWPYDASIAWFGGQPYVAWTERTQTGNAQLYVKTWNGSGWVSVGSGSLNQTPGAGWAFHPNLIADANNLYLGWVEQSAIGQKAQVFVSQYSGGSWLPLGGSLNVDPVNGSAQRVSVAIYNAQPVAAWGEVNLGALRQVYVKQWNGSSWTLLAGLGGAPDTVSPTIPTSLSATAVGTNQINLSWQPSTDAVGVAGYFVYRGGTQIANVTSTFSYQDTGVLPYTTYSYSVAAYDAAGNVSAGSTAATATTLAGATAALNAVALSPATTVGGLSTTGNTVTLSAPAPSGGATVTLASSDPGVTPPASVTIAAGSGASAPFTITTTPVSTSKTVTISATYNGVTQTASLTVNPIALSSVTLSPATVTGGLSTTANTVALNGPAPSGGITVTLGSSDPGVTVPSSVTIPAGSTASPAFTISTSSVTAATSVTVSATYNGVTKAATLTVKADSVSALSLSPASIAGGNSTTANTVKLTGPAPSGGATVTLSSSNALATVPASVTVPAGATASPDFTISTISVSATTTVSISATYDGVTRSATLTVGPLGVSALTLSPSSIPGGTSSTADTVTLNGPAPPGGAVVNLTSSDSGVSVPSSVTVPEGATTSPAFTVTTSPVAAKTSVTISAVYNGMTKTATLTVTPVSVSAVTLQPTKLIGGASSTANSVTLNGPAPSGGAVVNLTSSSGYVTVPASVTVPAGATVSPAFTITTSAVSSSITAIISASYDGVTKTASLTVGPLALSKLTLSPTSVVGGTTVNGNNKVSLTGPAPSGGITVALVSSDPTATVPASVTIPAGASVSPAFTISTTPVAANTPVTISASYKGVTQNATLTITPPSIVAVTLSPGTVAGGATTTANTVKLNGPAPAGGVAVSLTSSGPSTTVPASVTVPAGATISPAFAIATTAVTVNTTVTISASYNGGTRTSSLTVVPLAISAITLSPSSVVGGVTVAGNNRVKLNGAAPSGGITVALASSDPTATVPASVTIPAGASVSPAFTITTTAVAANTPVTISASYNGIIMNATLTVVPPSVSAVSLSPATVTGGSSTTANTVRLNGPASTGGTVVTLTSSDPSATVPASVTVPAGATISPTFTITTNAVSASTPVTISASYNGSSKTALLTVVPLALSALTLSPASVVGGLSIAGNNRVSLNGPAPSGGITVTLSSSDPTASVPASVAIAAGATTSSPFSIATTTVTTSTQVTVSAFYNGITKTAALTVNPPSVYAVILSPTSVVGGAATTNNTIRLNGPAPAGGAVVKLASSDPSATVPASVTVPAGATVSPAFTITTAPVAANTSVTISAAYNGTKTAILTVTP